MILQALKEYYDRKPDLPRAGFEMKEIPYVLVLNACLLYTSDAADDLLCVDLGGRRIIKQQTKT